MTRRGFFGRLAGAVLGGLSLSRVQAAGLVFHPDAFELTMAPLPPDIAEAWLEAMAWHHTEPIRARLMEMTRAQAERMADDLRFHAGDQR